VREEEFGCLSVSIAATRRISAQINLKRKRTHFFQESGDFPLNPYYPTDFGLEFEDSYWRHTVCFHSEKEDLNFRKTLKCSGNSWITRPGSFGLLLQLQPTYSTKTNAQKFLLNRFNQVFKTVFNYNSK